MTIGRKGFYRAAWVWVMATATVAAGALAAEGIEPVYVQPVQVGGFWGVQYKRVAEKWLPHCIRQMEEGGRGQELLNLVNTAKALRGEEHGAFTGLPWSDAYVYNTMEAACAALSIDPRGDEGLAKAQAFLRGKIEEWIPIILAAQMDSGYIHSYHTLNGREHYSDINAHEFYVMGYFLEMAVAHYRMTEGRDRRLYDAAVRLADHLDATFGPAPKRTWKNGHAGLEYALCRLGRLVNEAEGDGQGRKYFRLAKHFLDHQHEIEPNPYNQSERPAVEMKDASGHAVRATYFYTAMADVALLEGDGAYRAACERLWESAIHRKHYITGGVGASHNGEAFSADFDLRNDGYCESCAGCGMVFWADRMHRLDGKGHYHDVVERVVYNNVLGALELSGENFFYQNPLAAGNARYPWHACPCCVGNIPRTLLMLKDVMYATDAEKETLYVNHFIESAAEVEGLAGTDVRVVQKTEYPWRGAVRLTLEPQVRAEFAVKIRIPDRTESELYTAAPEAQGFVLKVNGKRRRAAVEDGYVRVRRAWRAGDTVELELPMPVQRVYCDARVKANAGRVAVIRGPLAYNFEQADHAADVRKLVIEPGTELEAVWKPEMLEGIVAIEGRARAGEEETPCLAVPNFVRLNRGGRTQVWMVEDAEKAIEPEELAEMMRAVRPVKRADLEEQSVDRVVVGDPKSERAHERKGEATAAGEYRNRWWRHAGGGWFSYRMKVDPEGGNTLLCTYWGGETGNRLFDLTVDGERIGRQRLLQNEPGRFFDVEYAIPRERTEGKESVVVRFSAAGPNATAGGVFDIWMLKGEQ